MLLPSQIKYSKSLRHFICIHFEVESLEEMLEHGQTDLKGCNTCNMFYNMVQSIEENIIDEEEMIMDVEVFDKFNIIIQKAVGKRGDKFLTLNYNES